MAEMRRTDKRKDGNDQPQFRNRQPKIETIHSIESELVRKTLIEAVCNYLKAARCDPAGKERHWLDCTTEMLGISDLSAACKGVDYMHKTFAAFGVAALMRMEGSQYDMNKKLIAKLVACSPLVRDGLRGRVIDFGCGVGWLGKLMKDEFGSEPIEIDIDRNALELGRFFGAPGLLHLNGERGKLPFPDGSFDAVAIRELLDVADWNEKGILEESYRVTRPDGILLMSEYYSPRLRETLVTHGFRPFCRTVCWSAWKKVEEGCREFMV